MRPAIKNYCVHVGTKTTDNGNEVEFVADVQQEAHPHEPNVTMYFVQVMSTAKLTDTRTGKAQPFAIPAVIGVKTSEPFTQERFDHDKELLLDKVTASVDAWFDALARNKTTVILGA